MKSSPATINVRIRLQQMIVAVPTIPSLFDHAMGAQHGQMLRHAWPRQPGGFDEAVDGPLVDAELFDQPDAVGMGEAA